MSNDLVIVQITHRGTDRVHVQLAAATEMCFDVITTGHDDYDTLIADICQIAPVMMRYDVDMAEAFDDAFRTEPKMQEAKTQPEVEALAAQLAWYAEFGDAFRNRFEDGYAIKGQVRTVPLDNTPDDALLETRSLQQAAQIGHLQEQAEQLEMERRLARKSAGQAHQLLRLLTPGEHLRLIDRNIQREHPHLWSNADAIDGGDSPALQTLAYALLEQAARTIEETGPDDVHVTLRAAERCAALVRGLQPAKKEEPHAT